MTIPDVIGLDEVVQKLQVRRLKGFILLIGQNTSPTHCEQESFRNLHIKKMSNCGKRDVSCHQGENIISPEKLLLPAPEEELCGA